MPDALLPVYATRPCLITDQRKPACAGFIARKVLSIDWPRWGQPVPPTNSQTWLLEACKAEVAWAHADYCRITGTSGLSHDSRYDGVHPSEQWRLPVEQLAARVLNAWGHVHVEIGRIRDALTGLRRARDAAANAEQSDAYRESWAQGAAFIAADLRALLAYRRRAWPVFVQAAREYRAARAAIDMAAISEAA
jgi:hypothetical protein